ncbi:MAG: caspase family protein, partial [Spirochaetales bacterium]
MIKVPVFQSLFIVFLLLFYLIFSFPAVAQSPASASRGMTVIAQDSKGVPGEVTLYNNTYALIVGIDNFKNLPASQYLKYCVNDAKGVKETLEKYYQFKDIQTLYNSQATEEGIYSKLLEMNKSMTQEDGLFVFIASHGITFDDVGYILPYDGSFDAAESYKNISMVELKDELGKRIQAKHIFYVIDACYSGSILSKRGTEGITDVNLEYLKEITREPVRYALTAGDAGQQVLDGGPKGHSVFTGRFIEALENTQDFITASALSEDITFKVFSDAKDRGHTQTPRHGSLSGLGNFVFLKKQGESLAAVEQELNTLQA